MFGIKKLKRRISELEISRNEWMKIAKTGLEEIKELKAEIGILRKSRDEWVKITNDKSGEIKTLKGENAKLKSDVEIKDNTIKTLEIEVERLTRKRDVKGRFVKMRREFKVGDKVRIKEGICFETVTDKSIIYSPSMDEHIGEIGEITTVRVGIIRVQFANNWWHFHPDWLEHAE